MLAWVAAAVALATLALIPYGQRLTLPFADADIATHTFLISPFKATTQPDYYDCDPRMTPLPYCADACDQAEQCVGFVGVNLQNLQSMADKVSATTNSSDVLTLPECVLLIADQLNPRWEGRRRNGTIVNTTGSDYYEWWIITLSGGACAKREPRPNQLQIKDLQCAARHPDAPVTEDACEAAQAWYTSLLIVAIAIAVLFLLLAAGDVAVTADGHKLAAAMGSVPACATIALVGVLDLMMLAGTMTAFKHYTDTVNDDLVAQSQLPIEYHSTGQYYCIIVVHTLGVLLAAASVYILRVPKDNSNSPAKI